MTNLIKQKESRDKATTTWRELVGWWGMLSWMFMMMHAFDLFSLARIPYYRGSWTSFTFMLLLATSIVVFSWVFRQDPNKLANIAFYSIPAATLITALLWVVPDQYVSTLYLLTAILMAPTVSRRSYGIIRSSEKKQKMLLYVSGFSVAFVVFSIGIIIAPMTEIAFILPALFSALSWFGIRRSLPPVPPPTPQPSLKFSRHTFWLFIIAIPVMLSLVTVGKVLLTEVFVGGDDSTIVSTDAFMAWLPPAACLILYAILSDRGYERFGFICGMSFSLIGIAIALMTIHSSGLSPVPLIIIYSFGSIYVEFFVYTSPIYFLDDTTRPVFSASLGCVFFLIIAALTLNHAFFPLSIFRPSIPLLAVAVIITIVFLLLVYFLFVKHQERSLASAVHSMIHCGVSEGIDITNKKFITENRLDTMLSSEEGMITLLLVEGNTRSDIMRRLHMPSSQVNQIFNSIQNKVNLMNGLNPAITTIVKDFKLTRREADMLRCLQEGMSNAKIATEFSISEATVKNHVYSLMTKLPEKNRRNIPSWIETYLDK